MISFIDILFVTIYISGFFLFYLLLLAGGEKLTRVNVFTVLIASLVLFSYVGLLPLYFYWDEYRYAIGITDRSRIWSLLLMSSWSIASILLVKILFSLIFKPVYFSVNIKKSSEFETIKLVLLLFISLFIFYNYLNRVDSIAILSVFDGDTAHSRSRMGNDFGSGYHWYKLFLYDVGAFITYAFFASFLIFRTRGYLALFLLSLFYSIFIALMATEKAPLAYLVVGLFIVFIYVKRRGVVNIKNILLLVALILSFLSLLYIVFMGADSFVKGLMGVFSRAFTGGIMPAYFYLEYYPDVHEFAYGKTLPNPKGIFDFEPYRYTVDVMNWVFPSVAEKGLVGSMPTVFWGEAYVNFGVVGVILIPPLVGFGICILQYLLYKLHLTPVSIAYLVWVMLFFKDLSMSGFGNFVWNIYFISITFFFILIYQRNGVVHLRKLSR